MLCCGRPLLRAPTMQGKEVRQARQENCIKVLFSITLKMNQRRCACVYIFYRKDLTGGLKIGTIKQDFPPSPHIWPSSSFSPSLVLFVISVLCSNIKLQQVFHDIQSCKSQQSLPISTRRLSCITFYDTSGPKMWPLPPCFAP